MLNFLGVKPFVYQDIFAQSHNTTTPYKLLTKDYVSTINVNGKEISFKIIILKI